MAAGDGFSVLFCFFLVIGTCLAQNDDLGVEESLEGNKNLNIKNRGEKFDEDFAVLNQDNSKTVGAKYDNFFSSRLKLRFVYFSVNLIVVVFFTLVKKALNLSEHFTFCLSDLHLIVPDLMKSCQKKSKKNVAHS